MPPKKKRHRFAARPKQSARFDMTMTTDEKRELEEATQRFGEPSLARFLVNAGLARARGTLVVLTPSSRG